MKRLVILGSTGSIGTNAADLVSRFPGRYRIVGLAARRNIRILEAQIRKFRPEIVAVAEKKAADDLKMRCRDLNVRVLSGREGIREVAAYPGSDMVLSAVVGSAGLEPTLAAIQAGKPLALANKEPLVMAGAVFREWAEKIGVPILPVDSEHSGVFQTLEARNRNEIRRIILTASGGPLIDMDPAEARSVKPGRALAHPTWKMGAKISIDSATLMNKGLEVIEAHHLFGLPPDRIDVSIHRQSIVHSMVEFVDGSVLAQMAIPDMRIPLSYALAHPDRPELDLPSLDLEKAGTLTFEPPDHERFPCLSYGYEALKAGGTMPAVLNASNEEAVGAYLREEVSFGSIAEIILETMNRHDPAARPGLEEILDADRWAREEAGKEVRRLAGR